MYLYELPTTGAISFADFCIDQTFNKLYTVHIPEVTQARANLRGSLKDAKRTDRGQKDFLQLVKVVEDYIPLLRGIISCLAHDEVGLRSEPSFSWRTTLSANAFNSSPRLSFPGCHTDLAFTLLTYAFSLSNLARSIVATVGLYEKDRAISEADRKAKDEQLSISVTFLCRASGIYTYICDTLLPELEANRGYTSGLQRPLDLSREINSALAKMALADAQSLAIRTLLSKSAYDSNISPGPPLPKSHRSPALIAKLHLECASLYASARSLTKTISARQKSPSSSSPERSGEVAAGLGKYLSDETAFHTALSHKWLGVDAGESGKAEKGGDAIGFLAWAKKGLGEMKDSWRGLNAVRGDKGLRDDIKQRVSDELASVEVFYKYYQKMNDTLHFQPVPKQTELQTRIPAGVLATPAKPYNLPIPAFGPGSLAYIRRQAEDLELVNEPVKNENPSITNATYAGAGSYF